MTVRVLQGDCRALLAGLPAASFHACVCDPPYHLTAGKQGGSGEASRSTKSPAGRARIGTGFMGKQWDGGDVANQVDTWEAVYRVLKPGAYLLAFGGTRTFHRMVCAIEDAGFEIRDCIRNEQDQETYLGWLYGTGFPKSLNVAKAIDALQKTPGTYGAPKSAAHAGWIDRGSMRGDGAAEGWQRSWMNDPDAVEAAARRYLPGSPEAAAWDGWGTALKPAWEPICVARKPLEGTVAANVLKHGCGALNIDASRIASGRDHWRCGLVVKRTAVAGDVRISSAAGMFGDGSAFLATNDPGGRWPANVIHDGSEAVIGAFPAKAGAIAPVCGTEASAPTKDVYGEYGRVASSFQGDGLGSAARFFWSGGRPIHRSSKPGRGDGYRLDKGRETTGICYDDGGSAARFFWSAKAGKYDRCGSSHPTIKPLALMRYLVRLVTPPGGHVLDCFAGSGSTGEAAHLEGFDATLCELMPEHIEDIGARLVRCGAADAGGWAVSMPEYLALSGCHITEAPRGRRKPPAVNITARKPAHNKHYVAPGAP